MKPQASSRLGLCLGLAIRVIAPLLFAALIVTLAFDEGVTTRIGRGSGATIVPQGQARPFWLAFAALLTLLALREIVRGAAFLRGLPRRTGSPPSKRGLALGEPILWSARPGLRALDARHFVIGMVLFAAMLPLVLSLGWVSTSPHLNGHGPYVTLFQLLFGLGLIAAFGPMAVVPTYWCLFRENRWLHAVTGRLAITDRRLVWLTWSGTVAHEIPADAIVEIVHTPRWRREREALYVTVRRPDGEVEDEVLRGLPRASEAAAALRRIARPSAH